MRAIEDVDKRNRLEEKPFSYRETKDQNVFLDYYGKQIKILRGKEAEKFLNRIRAGENELAEQLIMANNRQF